MSFALRILERPKALDVAAQRNVSMSRKIYQGNRRFQLDGWGGFSLEQAPL